MDEVRLYESLDMADTGVISDDSELVFFLYRDLVTGAVEESHVNNTPIAKISVSQIGRVTATT